MVAMVPSFISALMTSAAFTDMRCASSPTVMVSGTATSRTSGSVGCANVVCSPPRRWRGGGRRRGACQPPTPPPASPRVLIGAPARGIVAQHGGRLRLLRLLVGLRVAGRRLRRVQRGRRRCRRRRRGGRRRRFGRLLLGFACARAPAFRLQLGGLQLGELLLARAPLASRSSISFAIDGRRRRRRRRRRRLGGDRRGGRPRPGRASRRRASCAPRPGPCGTCRWRRSS